MYGLLGKLSTESEDMGSATGEMSIHDEIMAEQAFDEASELAHESAMLVTDMVQAESVAVQLDVQSALTAELLESPEQITPGAVAVSREAMVLALVALGATTNDFVVSKESMISAPVQAMEVTHEGIGDTAKKIYEGIKMVFKKIAHNIKKLAAKLIVAMNGTGKKAEKMLKSLNANSKLKLTKASKLEDKDVSKAHSSLGGLKRIIAATAATNTQSAYAIFTTNLKTISDMDEANTEDIATTAEKLPQKDGESPRDYAVRYMAGSKNSSAASTSAANAPTTAVKLAGAVELPGVAADDLSISDEFEPTTVKFYPTYVKGNKVHGIVTYNKKLDEADAEDVTKLMSLFVYKSASIDGYESDTDVPEHDAVLSVDKIKEQLIALKPASKQLKSFSDARMKDMDKLTKAINKHAKATAGVSIFNRLAGSQFNKSRNLAATQYLSSIFALASTYKADLANVARHISYYE